MMRTANPALNGNTFTVGYEDNAMTINGTVHKTGVLLMLVVKPNGLFGEKLRKKV